MASLFQARLVSQLQGGWPGPARQSTHQPSGRGGWDAMAASSGQYLTWPPGQWQQEPTHRVTNCQSLSMASNCVASPLAPWTALKPWQGTALEGGKIHWPRAVLARVFQWVTPPSRPFTSSCTTCPSSLRPLRGPLWPLRPPLRCPPLRRTTRRRRFVCLWGTPTGGVVDRGARARWTCACARSVFLLLRSRLCCSRRRRRRRRRACGRCAPP